jgi:homoserine O-acetyltransferase
MDLFDLGAEHQIRTAERRKDSGQTGDFTSCNLTLPDTPYEETEAVDLDAPLSSSLPSSAPSDLVKGLQRLRDTPVLVMGVASDILFPAWQQREIADCLRAGGNKMVTHVELGEDASLFGHDTFLLDLEHIGGNLRRFLA